MDTHSSLRVLNTSGADLRRVREQTRSLGVAGGGSKTGAEERIVNEQPSNLDATQLAAQAARLNIAQSSTRDLQAEFHEALNIINSFDAILKCGGSINFNVFSPDLVDFKDQNDETLLHHALRKGNKEVIDHLIGQGYSLTVKNDKGQNPLMLAALCLNNPEIFEALNRCDGYKDAIYADDGNGWTAFKCMTQCDAKPDNFEQLAQIMLNGVGGKSPEDYDKEFEQAKTSIDNGGDFSALVQSLPVNYKDINGNTLLHFAASAGNADSVQILLDAGYDFLAPNNDAQTPLMFAVSGGHVELIKFMRKLDGFGTAINMWCKHGHTPLMYACMSGTHSLKTRQDMIVQLFEGAREKGVGINHLNFNFPQNFAGNTLLQWVALELKNQQVLDVLLASPKLDIKAKNTSGQNIVMKAAAHGDFELVNALSGKDGFDQSMIDYDNFGWSAIHYTTLCFSGEDKRAETLENRIEIAKLLIQRNPALKTFTVNDGRTAAQLAQAEPELKSILS